MSTALAEPYPFNRPIKRQRIEVLAASIKQNGQQTPAQLVPHESKPGMYRITAGVTRWEACKLLGIDLTSVISDKTITPGEAARIMVAENMFRDNLTAPEAYELVTFFMKEEDIKTGKEAAQALGCSEARISRILGYAALPKHLEPLAEGVGATIVQEISRIPNDDHKRQALAFARDCGDGKPATKDQALQFIKRLKGEKPAKCGILKGKIGGILITMKVPKAMPSGTFATTLEELGKKVRKHPEALAHELGFLFR